MGEVEIYLDVGVNDEQFRSKSKSNTIYLQIYYILKHFDPKIIGDKEQMYIEVYQKFVE